MDPVVEVPSQLGEFLIRGVLGQGGSGIVYDASWGPRRVALKVVHPSLASTERVRAQFLTEAGRLQAIAHPAVVKVLAVGELPDGRPYLAMERLEGETLAGVLARGPLPLAQALALFDEISDAVGALHAQGLVHRDLKPENVFVVDGAHAVLLDFGIAKELAAAASTTTLDGNVRGTPAYMAPERFFGQPAGVATDLYELAVTLYAMLAGRLPWDDAGDPEARLSPQPLTDHAPVPEELDVEVRRAMSTRAQNRPPSARAFQDAVRLAAGTASSVPRPSETARMAPAPQTPWFANRQPTTDRGKTPLAWAPTESATPVARRKRWPYVAAGGALVAATGAVIAWRAGGDAPPAEVHQVVAATDDPWGPGYEPPKRPGAMTEIPQTGAALPVATARAEIAAAIDHVPADTQVLFTAIVGDLRGNDQARIVLAKLAKERRVADMLDAVPCLQPIVTGSEWVVFAAKSLQEEHHATLILRGRWQRADIERCFSDQIKPLALQDGSTILELPRLGWLDFLDDHTVYLSVREDLAAAQVHDLARRGKGPAPRVRELLGRLPPDRTLAAVIDGTGKLVWPGGHVPSGSDLAAWLTVRDDGAALDVRVDARNEILAQTLVLDVKPTFDDLYKGSEPALVGRIDVLREKTVFVIRGRLSPLMIGMIAAGIP